MEPALLFPFVGTSRVESAYDTERCPVSLPFQPQNLPSSSTQGSRSRTPGLLLQSPLNRPRSAFLASGRPWQFQLTHWGGNCCITGMYISVTVGTD